MRIGEFVLVHCVNPREKFWGMLEEQAPAGVTVRGLSPEGFDQWVHEIARGDPPSIAPATVFFPIHRIDRVFADESFGELVSYVERLRRATGKDPRAYLAPEMPED